MLLCHIDNVHAGMTVGAVVLHPQRPEMELLSAGATLDDIIIRRLRELGVCDLWIHHDALADLDAVLAPHLTETRLAVYTQLKEDFNHLSAQTITTTQVLVYRKTLLQLVFNLVGNRRVAGLTDQLFGARDGLFSHCANVAYLSVLAGLELENYIISERKKLAADHARDLTSLGLGAMLHDIGKTPWREAQRAGHEVWLEQRRRDKAETLETYRSHALAGHRMLVGSRAPASATQAVLNHHQRFDGRGWPDLSEVTRNRRSGPQSGRGIHIFSRIVAVANVLDNLMRDPAGGRRPPVAALYDLHSKRFDGWFDPIVRQVLLRRLAPYQVGSHVVLSDGRQAAVLAPSLRQPCQPVVRVLDDAARDADGKYPTIHLEKDRRLRIIVCAGQDVRKWHFELSAGPRCAPTVSAGA